MAEDIVTLGIKADATDIDKADKSLNKITKTAQKTEKATDGLNQSTKKATDSLNRERIAADKATNSINNMATATRALKTALVGFIASIGIRQLKELSDEAISINNRLKQVTKSAIELEVTFAALLKISNETRTGLSSTSVLYQRLALASEELNLSSRELLRLTETINKSFAVSGATATETAGAIRQLAQGLAAGALRGDEFNSVAEQAPEIMRAIAQETGLTLGALREFAATGGITAEIVIKALQGIEEEIDDKFAKSTATFDQQLTIMNNNLLEWANNNEDLTGSMTLLGKALAIFVELLIIVTDVILKVVNGWGMLISLVDDLLQKIPGLGDAYEDANKPLADTVDFTGLLIDAMATSAKVWLKMTQIILAGPVFVYNLLSTTIKELVNVMLDGAIAVADFGGASDETIQNLRNMQFSITSITDQNAKFTESFAAGQQAIEDWQNAGRDVVDVAELANQAFDEMDRLLGDISSSFKESDLNSFANGVDDLLLNIERQNIGLDIAEEFLRDLNSTMSESSNIYKEWDVLIKEATDDLKKQAKAEKLLAKEQAKEQKLLAKRAKEARREWLKTRDTLADAFVDMFDNGKNVFEDLFDGFKNLIKRMIATAAANKILLSIGLGGASGANAQGTLGELLGSAGTDKLIGGFIDSAVTGISSVFSAASSFGAGTQGAAALSQFGPAVGPGFAQITAAVETGGTLSNLANGLAEAAPWASALAGALEGFGNKGVVGALGGAAGGFFGAQAGAAAGAQLGTAIAGPIGTAVGAALGAVLGGIGGGKLGAKLFGTDFQTQKTSLQFGVTDGEFSAQSLEKQKKEGGLFSSTSRRIIETQLDQFDEVFNALQAQVETTFANITGIVGPGLFREFESTIAKFKISGKTEEEINASINSFFSQLADEMTNFLVEGLTFEELQGLESSLSVANSIMGALNITLFQTSIEGAKAAQAFLEQSGTVEELIAKTNQLYTLFTDEAQKSQDLIDGLTAAFIAMDLTIPTTNQAMLDLVAGLDLTTQAGIDQFNTLSALAPSIRGYIDLLDEQSQAEKQRLIDEKAALSAAEAGVIQLFNSILGRDPDVEALEFYIDSIINSGDTLAHIADIITISSENATKEITKLYQDILEREPDTAGLEFYIDQVINSGVTFEKVALILQDSQEFVTLEARKAAAQRIKDAIDEARALSNVLKKQISPAKTVEQLFTDFFNADIEAITGSGNELLTAIEGRYNDEIALIDQAKNAALSSYSDQLVAAERFNRAAAELTNTADQLLLNEAVSPLNDAARAFEATAQANALIEQAKAGDVGALETVGDAVQTALELNREVLKSSPGFTELFQGFQDDLRELGGTTAAAPDVVDIKQFEDDAAEARKTMNEGIAIMIERLDTLIGTQTETLTVTTENGEELVDAIRFTPDTAVSL